MIRLQKFFKTAGIFMFGNVITKMLSFLLLPLYTARIEPKDFGSYGLVISLVNLFVPLVFFQVWDGVFRLSFDFEEEKEKFKILLNGYILMIIGAIISLFIYGIIKYFYNFEYGLLIFLYCLGVAYQYFYGVITRSFERNSLFVSSGCLNSFVMLLLNIILIIYFNKGIEALYISSIIGSFVQIILIEYKIGVLKKFKIRFFSNDIIKEILKFSAPISISTITTWLLGGYTQLMISKKLGLELNGVFNVANKFSALLILIIGVFQFAWNETTYILAKDKNKIKYYNQGINEMLKFTLVLGGLFILTIKICFPYLIDIRYIGALKIIPILILGTVFNSFNGLLGTLFLANKDTKKLFYTSLISGIVNVLGLTLLMTKFGLIGGVLSLTLSMIIGCICRLVFLFKNYKIKLEENIIFPFLLFLISVFIFSINLKFQLIIFCIISYLLVSLYLLKKWVYVFIKTIKNKVVYKLDNERQINNMK